jgi:hypothetical protein
MNHKTRIAIDHQWEIEEVRRDDATGALLVFIAGRGTSTVHLEMRPDAAQRLHAELGRVLGAADVHKDIAVKLADVLRHLHNLPGLDQIVETVCENRGVEIDWAATPADQEGGGAVGDHG